jgi:hypothetical protein
MADRLHMVPSGNPRAPLRLGVESANGSPTEVQRAEGVARKPKMVSKVGVRVCVLAPKSREATCLLLR